MPTRLIIGLSALLLILSIHSRVLSDSYVFVTFQFPPLEYEGLEGKANGIAVDIVARVMKNLGHQVEIRVYPWTRSLKMVRNGGADAIFTAYRNSQREIFLDYSRQVLFPQVVYFYKRKDAPIDFDGHLATVKEKRIGVVSTISYGEKFDLYKSLLNFEKANKLEHNFGKLLLGRIDLVPCNVYVADYTLGKMGLAQQIVPLSPAIENVPSYIAFSKKRNLTQLRDQFDRQLVQMKANDEYADILRKYGIRLHISEY